MVKISNNKLLWQDKINFSQTLIEKELEMISQYTATINNVKYNQFPKDRLHDLSNYRYCWANLNNLYDVLIYDYGSELEKEEKEKLDEIIEKYRDLDGEVTIKDLTEAKKLVLKIVSKAGFHDLVRKGEESEDDF